MKTRVLSSMLAIPIVLALTYFGNIWFLALMIFGSVLAAYELSNFLAQKKIRTTPLLSAFISGSLVLTGFILAKLDMNSIAFPLGISILSLASVAILPLFTPRAPTILTNLLISITAGVYVGGLLCFAPLLREGPNGLEWTLYLFVTITLTDSGAYAVGKTIGRTPFFPKISPSKTLEGALGGFIFGVIGSLLSVHFLEIKMVTLIESSVTGLILSSCAQIGDLYESLLKRKSGVKDSGRLLPGHGGALDRLDSIVFSLCVLYYFTQWIST